MTVRGELAQVWAVVTGANVVAALDPWDLVFKGLQGLTLAGAVIFTYFKIRGEMARARTAESEARRAKKREGLNGK